MKIEFHVNDAATLAELHGISPARFIRLWAVVVKNLAKQNAQNAAKESGGRSFWQRQILPSVHEEVNGAQAIVHSDNYIAEHVHTGGVIRPQRRKYLAIPLDDKAKKTSPEQLPWHTSDGEPIFLRRKRGPGWVMMDAVGRKKNPDLVPRYALIPETAPQKPRPWWPTDAQVNAETERFFREDF